MGSSLTDDEVRELLEILRVLRRRSEQQGRQIAELRASLDKSRRDRWIDWVAGAVVGLALSFLAKILGFPT